MKSKKIISVILIMLCTILTSCSDDIERKINDEISDVGANHSKLEERTIKDDNMRLDSKIYSEGKVDIIYPQIIQLPNESLKESINEKISKQALRRVNEVQNDEKVTTLEIAYDIKRYDNKLLSVLFEGYINSEGAPYPLALAYTLNISMDSGEELELNDYFQINETYVEQYHQNKLNVLKSFQSEAFEGLSDEEILTMFRNAELYLTKDSLGLVVFVPHAVGDYAELEVQYNELKDTIESDIEWDGIIE